MCHIHWALFLKKLKFPEPYKIFMDMQPDIAHARNHLVKMALDKGAEYILFIDTDTIPHVYEDGKLNFKEDIINLLFEHIDSYDVVSGLYYLKRGSWSAFVLEKDATIGGWRAFLKPPIGRSFEADASGLGFCLAKKDLFKRMDPPWFDWIVDSNFKVLDGEDGYFFKKLKRIGGKLLIDARIICLHIADVFMTGDRQFAATWTFIDGL